VLSIKRSRCVKHQAGQHIDLVSVWHLLDATQRNVVRARLNPGEVQWRRGMAWAFEQAMGLVWYYEVSNSLVSLWGRRTHAGSLTNSSLQVIR
jgi:hypothetical protein